MSPGLPVSVYPDVSTLYSQAVVACLDISEHLRNRTLPDKRAYQQTVERYLLRTQEYLSLRTAAPTMTHRDTHPELFTYAWCVLAALPIDQTRNPEIAQKRIVGYVYSLNLLKEGGLGQVGENQKLDVLIASLIQTLGVISAEGERVMATEHHGDGSPLSFGQNLAKLSTAQPPEHLSWL